MQRRTFATAVVSSGFIALAGCLGGGSSESVEVSDVSMKRKNKGTTTETVILTGTVTNVANNPVKPTVTVTFLRKSQELNPVEKTLGEIQPDKSAQFEAESVEMGRTARQINGYKLKVSANDYTMTTQATTAPE